MRHPTDGTLRRLLDEPAGVADADREHVAGCPVCLSGLAAAQRGRGRRRRGAGRRASTPDVDAAWHRLSQRGRRRRPPAAAAAAAAPAGGARRCAAR